MVKMLIFDIKKTEQEFLDEFDCSDFEITTFEESLNSTTRLTLSEYDKTVILSVFTDSNITSEVIEKFKNLRVIVTRSIEYSHIDTEACRQHNIAVINICDYGSTSVAQYVIGSVLGMTRNILLANNDLRNGKYNYEDYEGYNADKLSIGVIGTGIVGCSVCEFAHKIGMKIYANDITINRNIANIVEYVSFNDLLRKSDIVTLHIPYAKEFKHIISEREFNTMKQGSYIINTSSAELIDNYALYIALKSGKLKGATLDMLMKDDYDVGKTIDYHELREYVIREKLLKMNNVIITPCIAYDTKETLKKILKSNFHDIKDFYIGRKTNRVV